MSGTMNKASDAFVLCLPRCCSHALYLLVPFVCQVYSFDGTRWSSLGLAPWSARGRATLTSFADTGRLLVRTGSNASGVLVTSDAWRSSAGAAFNAQWSSNVSSLVAPRHGAVAIHWRGLAFLLGGCNDEASASVCYNSVTSMSSDGAVITYSGLPPWSARKLHGAVVLNDQLIVFGQRSDTRTLRRWRCLSAIECSLTFRFADVCCLFVQAA